MKYNGLLVCAWIARLVTLLLGCSCATTLPLCYAQRQRIFTLVKLKVWIAGALYKEAVNSLTEPSIRLLLTPAASCRPVLIP
jgi:hypothetical protein